MKRLRLLLLFVVLLASAPTTALAATVGATTLADPSSASTWRNWGLENSTQNVGRIWTDKTVSAGDIVLTGAGGDKIIPKEEDSDFLTAFSAISSTSNLRETATTPLDIVLVLDASGSMADPMGRTDSTKRIDALKAAANSFIDEIAARNALTSDASQQHRVSIVKFSGDKSDRVGNDTYRDGRNTYNYSQVMKTMDLVTADTAASFKSTVDSIKPAGATRSDNGLELAQSQLSNARADARKIVVFFTDGKPTSFSEFDDGVASSAIATAKAIKDAGGTVYTIGIFSGANAAADPTLNGTSSENKFMQAVSSNYPNATYASSWGGYSWNLGTHVDGAAFYKTATNADELKKVFDGISKEISDAAGYPTDVTDGLEHASGYVTFTDQLGDYMKVDDFNHIVFANQVFDAHTKTTSGNVDTYLFEGSVQNTIYPNGNLNTIIIQVRRAAENDLRTGDHVTVKIPAALIPLRAFEVNADNNTGSVTLTFPIRVFFGSSLKDGVTELLANPDAQMTDYIAGHTDNGKVYFLANTWSGRPDGNAMASFTPARENSYYYITRDTPIYEDKALTQPAAYPLVKGKTYYYERTFWNISGTSASQGSHIVSFDSSAVENIDGYISDTGDGHAQFSQGTPRMTYINELQDDKDANRTETASSFINPKWSGNQVFVWLGNNGKLSLPEPGSLEVSKTIVVPEGFDAAVYANQDFDFTVSIPEAKGKTVTGTVTDASGKAQGDANFSIAFNANGTYTHKLKGGQKLTITGLSAGWKYEVTEARRSGWAASPEGASGSIAAGEKSVAAFTNKYGATGKLDAATSLNGDKTLSGRAWTAQDKFCFVLTGIGGAPMPEGASDGKAILQMTQSEGTPDNAVVPFHFGDITYTKPGTYVYNIVEARAGDGYDVTILPGVSVSQALYRVTVTVTDKNHDGTLVVTSTMLRLKDDSGATLGDGAGVETNSASFTNVFNVDEAEWDLRGTKHYEDKTGSRPLFSGMFQFELEPVTKGAPMPANADATTGKARASVDATGRFAFEQVTFGKSHVNPDGTSKPYEYKLHEVNGGAAGVTYDTTACHITVTVSLQDGDVVLDVQNTREGQEAKPGETVSFSNSYKAEPAEVNGFIHGTKTLMGRDALDGEKFAFSLTQVSGPEDGCTGFSATAEVADAKDRVAEGFDFGTATFTRAGTYVFKVREVAPAKPADGMTYDGQIYTVTVKVADEGGKLVVQSTTYSDDAARDVKAATFTNTYRPADVDYAGITVSKTLIGRTMLEGEFNFTITGEDEQSQALLAQKAAPSDCAFANDGQRASGEKDAMSKLSGLRFDHNDVGKTFRFAVAEVVPADGKKLPGVTYDQTVHHVEISVADALNGTLAVTTTIDGDDDPGNEVAFQNTYQAAPDSFATANFGLAKVLKGRDWASTDAFTFKLVGLSGAPMPANSQVTVKAADASNGRAPFDFGQISYAAAGTYEYEVHEVNAGQTVKGVDYTTNVAHFRVTVTDSTATGQLVASSRLELGSAAFENRYSAELNYNAMGGLTITKTLEGTSAPAGKFSFTVKPDGEDILGIAGTYASGKLTNGGTVTVAATSGEIVFTQNDAGKTWNYTVTEKDPDPGYTCDCSKWNVSVSVANDVENGRLLVTTTVSGEGGTRSWTYASGGEPAAPGATVAFVNRYAAMGSTAEIVGTKTLNGRLMSAREFEFQLVDEAGEVVATAHNDESGSVNFGSLSYTAPGTYTYKAREVTDGLAEGVTPVTSRFTIMVKVTDHGDGTLVCDVDYPKGGLAFVNSYGASDAEIEVSGTKVLEGRDLRDSEFDFTITAKTDGAPMPERTEVTNAKEGGFSFGKIRFTLDNVFGGVVIQDADGEAGQSGEVPSYEEPAADSESEAGPRVEAPSSETGEKDAELEPAAPETEPVSDPSDSPAPAEEPQQDELLAQDEVTDLGTPVVEEVSAPDAEAASTPDATDAATVNAARWQTVRRNLFHIASEVVEPLAGTSRQRTFHYVVTEETRSPAGVTNDRRNTRDIYITVTDDGHGKLTAAFTKADGSPLDPAGQPDLTFTNVYKPKSTLSSVTDQVTIIKALTGRGMVDGEFHFEMLEGVRVVATGTNAADGTVALSPITYDAPGTHSYEIREVNGGKTIDGVRYSGTTYHVNTTVSDTGEGELAVTHELVEEGPATFTNAYEATPADVTIMAHKELLGATLADGQFAFQLTGMGSDLRATNDAQGNVAFPHLLLTEPGTYTYELRELNDGQEGVTYDERVYVVTVTVTDDGLGHLSAEVSMDAADGALTFTNTYTPPVTPEEPPAPKPPTKPDPTPAPKPARPSRPLSKTGDVTSDAIVVTLVAVAVALLAGTLAMRRRR